jgi:aminoglycoside 3-N-acetyltransferase
MTVTMIKLAKKIIKNCLKSVRRAWRRISGGFSTATLKQVLVELGLSTGDIVMVHVGMKHFEGFQGSADDVIDCLLEIVGEDGTLLMPSMTFQSTAVQYVESGVVTDIRNSPSAMGLVTEVFRLRPETIRSINPTHPVLAQGRFAVEMLAKHIHASTPCGEASPFGELLSRDGKVLILGPDFNTNTFYHFLEEAFEDELPGAVTKEVFEIPVIDAEGDTIRVRNRLYDPALSRKRDQIVLERQLRRDGKWREANIGSLHIVLVEASDIYASMATVTARGEHCYIREIVS